MGIRVDIVQADIDQELKELQAVQDSLAGTPTAIEGVSTEEMMDALKQQIKYHENRLFFFAFQIGAAEREDENDRLRTVAESYESDVHWSDPLSFKDLGDGKFRLILTAKALVILSAAVNNLHHELQEAPHGQDTVTELAKEGKMTEDDVWYIAEELITSIPSNFDSDGNPTDGFDE